MIVLDSIKKQDIEVFNYINDEKNRQENNIELIASENFVSNAVEYGGFIHTFPNHSCSSPFISSVK